MEKEQNIHTVSRRTFLASASGFSLSALLVGCAGKVGTSSVDLETIDLTGVISDTGLPLGNDPEVDITTRATTPTKPRRGIQAVFLTHWSTKSCDNLVAVLSESNAPIEFEIMFCPYIKSRTVTDGKYNKPIYVIEKILESNKTINLVVTVHIGYHSGTGGDNIVGEFPCTEALLKDFYNKFFSVYASNPRVTVVLCPSLEDRYTAKEFEDSVALVGNTLSKISTSTKTTLLTFVTFKDKNNKDKNKVTNLRLRRNSIYNQKVDTPYTISKPITLPDGSKIKNWEIGVSSRELHGKINLSAQVYSNDGNFVYFNNPQDNKDKYLVKWIEVESSIKNSGQDNLKEPNTAKYKINDFISKTENSEKIVLLWRPAYNLKNKTITKNKVVYPDNKGITERTDSGETGFDQVEQEVLRLFLGMK
jgi:hypothetical protein